MALKLIQSRIHLAIIQSLGALTDGLEQQRLRIELGIDSGDVEDNSRRCAIVPTSYNIAITYNEKKLPFIAVI